MSSESSIAPLPAFDPRLPPATVVARGQTGYLFRSADQVFICFVPADCLFRTEDGQLGVDDIKYFLSGWGIRNLQMSDIEADGAFVFPDPDRLIEDLEAPASRRYLRRIAAARPAAAGPQADESGG